MAKVNLISQAEYAKHRGVSEAAVSKAVKGQRITLIDGKIDAMVADVQWSANTRARIGSGPQASTSTGARQQYVGGGAAAGSGSGVADDQVVADGDGYWVSRTRREAAEAELAELKLAEQRGDLIQVKAVESVWSGALASFREHLLQVRSRLAPLLAAESDPYKVDQLLDLEHSQALQLLASVRLQPGGTVQ